MRTADKFWLLVLASILLYGLVKFNVISIGDDISTTVEQVPIERISYNPEPKFDSAGATDVPAHIKKQHLVLIEQSKALIKKRYGKDIKVGTITYSITKPTLLGTAQTGTFNLDFNAAYAIDAPTLFKKTVIHEFAHLVQYQVYPDAHGNGHGKRWKEIMKVLGIHAPTSSNSDATMQSLYGAYRGK